MTVSGEGESSVHAVLLAAGMSARFGPDNKLLSQVGGATLVRHVADELLASHVGAVTVVVGYQANLVQDALAGLDVQFVINPDFEHGLSSSLRRGIAALDDDPAGAMVVLADMPGMKAALVNALIEAFEREGCEKIIFPMDPKGEQGNPVIWPRAFFGELQSLTGDRGAKKLIARHRAHTLGFPVENARTLRDIDATADLEAWNDIEGS